MKKMQLTMKKTKWKVPLSFALLISFFLIIFTLSTKTPFQKSPVKAKVPIFVESKLHIPHTRPISAIPKLAYLISGSSGDGESLKRTLKALYHPLNQCVVHLDLEAPADERLELVNFVKREPLFVEVGNVRVVVRSNLVTYRGPTMVSNTLHAAAIFLKEGGEWDWFINLSASDYPLVTQDDLLHTFSTVPRELNFIEHTSDIGWKEYYRARPVIIDSGLYSLNKSDLFGIPQKRSMPTAFKLFTGNHSLWVPELRTLRRNQVLLIDNISRPAPNITHLLLKFDVDGAVERTVLQPKFHYSCLKIILDFLEKLLKPDINALLYEFAFQLLYELCTDPLTCNPMMDLLSTKKYWFFVQHLDLIGIAPLPKRNSSQALRISSLHQRTWLLKLLTIELHAADMSSFTHREACQSILSQLFGEGIFEHDVDLGVSSPYSQISPGVNGARMISKTKVLELLEVVQFKSPDTVLKSSQAVSSAKYGFLAEDILTNPATSERGGVYYYSERGDRLIDLATFRDKLWQKYNLFKSQHSSFNTEVELNEIRDTIQQLLRWGWKYNKNLEEQAAQLHMLTGWSQIFQVSASSKISSFSNRSEILFQLLGASLGASGSPDCSLKMALILTQVGVTCMAKLRDERFLCPSGLNSDTVTCLDIMMTKQLSNGACHSILFKLILAILRNESSEALRKRQYALLLSYIQYCQHMLDPCLPTTVMQLLTMDEQENDDLDLEKIVKDQTEMAHAKFSIIRKEAQSLLDLIIKDATHGSESGKTISLYVLDALICIDHEKFFLSQLQSRGFLRSCLMNINNFSQDGGLSLESMQCVCTLEAELALLLRISHKYGKSGAQVLFSMGAYEHISACKALNMQLKGSYRLMDVKFGRELSVDVDKLRMIIAPILRLVFSLTSLIDASEFFEVKNKVVREVIEFVRSHQLLFDQILREELSDADDLTMEQINLVVGILTKIWPYEETDEYGFVQWLFVMMHLLFSREPDSFITNQPIHFLEERRKAEMNASRLCFSLSSYLCFLVTKKSLRLPVSDGPMDYHTSAGQRQPTLNLLGFLLNSLTTALERATEDRYLLLSKIQDINELSRQEVDEIINMCVPKGCISSSENIQKRRYVAMLEMCQIVGDRNQLMTLLLLLAENVMNIILVHFQDSSFECGTKPNSKDDLSLLCGKLISALERLELLSKDKTGHDLKVFRRLASSLKEISIQKSPV